jgi:small conductance mechanosensitive channel
MGKLFFGEEYEHLKEIMELYGLDLIQSMLILVVGVVLLHWFIRRFRIYLDKTKGNQWPVKRISAIVYIILLFFVLNLCLFQIGLDIKTIGLFLAIISLFVIAFVIVLRPYFPTLPFHVGNTVLIDGLFGKVIAINMYHTHLKTFDGKMVFIPNSKVMKNVITNYHQTPGRRIKINVSIPYTEDLIKAKQVLEAVMVADPRVLVTPRPQVWALSIEGGSVELGGRCWADNENYWLTKCDLVEMIKLRFDHQGIQMALPMQKVFFQSQLEDESESVSGEFDANKGGRQ